MADQIKPCIFCAIAAGNIPSKKVYEDGESIAFLDINPRSVGMTIVAPKSHYSQINDNPLSSLKVFQTAQNVAKMIKDSLSPDSVAFASIPSEEVPHFHIRLYPIYANEKPLFEGQPIKTTDQELENLAEKIRAAKSDLFAPPKKEETAGDQFRRSDEEVAYIRKQLEIT
jgi:histidine triad (HIT) family protein